MKKSKHKGKPGEIDYGSFLGSEIQTEGDCNDAGNQESLIQVRTKLTRQEKKAFRQSQKKNRKNRKTKNNGARVFRMVFFSVFFSLLAVNVLVVFLGVKSQLKQCEEKDVSLCAKLVDEFETIIESDIKLFYGSKSKDIFSKDTPLALVYNDDSGKFFANSNYFSMKELEGGCFKDFFEAKKDIFDSYAGGSLIIENANAYFEKPMIAVFLEPIVLLYSSESLASVCDGMKDSRVSFVNQDGIILFSPDEQKMAKFDLSQDEIVGDILLEKDASGKKHYNEKTLNEVSASWCRIENSQSVFIIETMLKDLLASVKKDSILSLCVSIAILLIVVIISSIFSSSIKSDDTNEKKNQRQKKGRAVAGPQPKAVSVSFTDIRDFSKIKEDFCAFYKEDGETRIMEFLNEYFSSISKCISMTGGKIEKYEGDGFLCVWGSERKSGLDARERESYKVQDVMNAIASALLMRYTVFVFNRTAVRKIKTGTAINFGVASIGFLGSDSDGGKLEHSVIGSSVSFAKKSEKINKLCSTDIILTQDALDIIKMDFVKCLENGYRIPFVNKDYEVIVEKLPVAVDDKNNGKQNFYAVVNMPNFSVEEFFSRTDLSFVSDAEAVKTVGRKGPKNLKELRLLLGLPEPR